MPVRMFTCAKYGKRQTFPRPTAYLPHNQNRIIQLERQQYMTQE